MNDNYIIKHIITFSFQIDNSCWLDAVVSSIKVEVPTLAYRLQFSGTRA